MFGSKSFAYFFLNSWNGLKCVMIPSHVTKFSGTVLFSLLSVSEICMYEVYVILLNNRLLSNYVTREFTSSGNPPDLV